MVNLEILKDTKCNDVIFFQIQFLHVISSVYSNKLCKIYFCTGYAEYVCDL